MTRSLASALVAVVFSSFAIAQEVGGNCNLLVVVRTSDERRIEAPIRVEVLSPNGVIAVQTTGGDSAQIRIASGRTYSVKVSGTNIEAVTTPYFEINPLEASHTETVHVKLAKSGSESAPGSSTISVSEMNIPRSASGDMQKGLDAYSKGNMEKAEACFEKAIAEYSNYARAYYMLGLIAIKASDRIKAKEFFSKSIQADGTFLAAYVDLARMNVQEQRYAESEALLAKAIAVNPSSPDALALLATTEFANKEYDKALADGQRTHALPNHEQFAEVHIMAGKVLSMQNHPGAAIAQFQLFLKEKPDSPEAEDVRKAIASLMAGPQP